MSDRITITIKKENWKKLSHLKLDWDVRSFDEVLEKLIKKSKKK